MKNILKSISVGLLIGVIAYVAIISVRQNVSLGNIESDAMYYKNITATNASTTSAVAVKGGAGILGTIAINNPSGVALAVYDGNGTTTGATLIGTIKATPTQITLIYNVAVQKGIVLGGAVGFNGDYTISYK